MKKCLVCKNGGVCDFIKYITCFLFNSLAKPYLEALESMLEEEEHEDGEEEDITKRKKKGKKEGKRRTERKTCTESS